MERTELAEEKGMERRSAPMRAEDGSSSTMQMVVEAEPEEKTVPAEKVVKGLALAEKQGTIKGKESMGVDERDEEHDSSSPVAEMQLVGGSRRGRSKKVMEKSEQTSKKVMERSVSKAEDETSSSSWMQMVGEAQMLALALQIIAEEMAESSDSEEVGSTSSSSSNEEHDSSSCVVEMHKIRGSNEEHDSSSCVVEMHKIRGSNEDHDSSSCVVEMHKIRDDMKRWTRPSIYRVPDWLKSMTKAEAYRPQAVSLGPFHHGEQSLRPMEEHKLRLMLHMVERSKKSLDMFKKAINEVAEELQGAYDGLDEEWRGDNTYRFVDVMVTDAGFLLEFMTTVRRARLTKRGVLEAGYAPYDPIFSKHSLLSLRARLRSDMILVENQVPLLALQKLEAVRSGTSPSNAYINEVVTDFICPNPKENRNLPFKKKENRNPEKLGLHTLEMFHRNFCSQPLKDHQDELRQSETTMLSAEELREAGVHFKESYTRSVQDIDFKNGVLSMPLVEIGDDSERTFLNLMAFERLHCNAGSVATDYMIFMDNIIDSERDVALLRSKKVLRNFLGSDKAAADLFNTLGKGATLTPGGKVGGVQWLVARHCEKPWPKLQASFKHTYLRNPWVFFSALAAIILLVLTILQTVYTVMPYYTKN